MSFSITNLIMALGVLAIGVAVGAPLLYAGQLDDAPPLGLMGILLMIGAAVLSVRIARRKP